MKGLEMVHFVAVDLAAPRDRRRSAPKVCRVQNVHIRWTSCACVCLRSAAGDEGGQAAAEQEMYKTRSLEAGCINNGLTQLQSIFGELIRRKISKAQGHPLHALRLR